MLSIAKSNHAAFDRRNNIFGPLKQSLSTRRQVKHAVRGGMTQIVEVDHIDIGEESGCNPTAVIQAVRGRGIQR